MNLCPLTMPVFLRFSGYALALNGIWEFVQCSLLYDTSRWKMATSIFEMATAILGDVVLGLLVIYVAAVVVGQKSAATTNSRMFVTAFLIGAAVGIATEWSARVLGFWEYTSQMPVIRLAGVTVGLTPVLQMALLPALSLYFAARKRSSSGSVFNR